MRALETLLIESPSWHRNHQVDVEWRVQMLLNSTFVKPSTQLPWSPRCQHGLQSLGPKKSEQPSIRFRHSFTSLGSCQVAEHFQLPEIGDIQLYLGSFVHFNEITYRSVQTYSVQTRCRFGAIWDWSRNKDEEQHCQLVSDSIWLYESPVFVFLPIREILTAQFPGAPFMRCMIHRSMLVLSSLVAS